MPDNPQLIRDSWAQLRPRADEFARLFYQRLFEQSPRSAMLFADVAMAEQHRKFTEMIDDIVTLVDRPEELTAAALALGGRHAAYGVRDGDYPDVGATLLSVIDDLLGEQSSGAVLDAWREAYSLLASVMQRGAREA